MASSSHQLVRAKCAPRRCGAYLHDGRATTVEAAILAHDGEAKVSRERYLKLTPAQKKQLSEFLLSI